MYFLCLSPEGTNRAVGGPIMSTQRSYTMHYRSSTKTTSSFTNQPFKALYDGVFFSRAEAKAYAELFRAQGLSFNVEGVAGAREYLAAEVERAREVGDTMTTHVSLLPFALLSGVNGDCLAAATAAANVARVTTSAAARHRSLRHLCDSILHVLRVLAGWGDATDPILWWDDGAGGGGDADSGKDVTDDGGPSDVKKRCTSAKELFNTWLRTAHGLFWGWRRDVLLYLDADNHSDVTVVKDNVRRWIGGISSTSRMGLQLPMLRWHGQGRTVAEGKESFIDAVTSISKCLQSLSGWLHCIELSLAWDAGKVCDRVHSLHVSNLSKVDMHVQGGRGPTSRAYKNRSGLLPADRTYSAPPTALTLLQSQRAWLDHAVAAAEVSDQGAASVKGRARKSTTRRKMAADFNAAAIEDAIAKGTRYQPRPVAQDSTAGLKGVDVRLAVIDMLREDIVPEALAHELTLMKYATDNRVDESLQESISDLVTSISPTNPYPALTHALSLKSTTRVLSRVLTLDKDALLPTMRAWRNSAERGRDHDECSNIYITRKGQHDGGCLFGSKLALSSINVAATLAIFADLPPIASWLLDALGEEGIRVDHAISGPALQCGQYSHNTTPSEVRVFVSCSNVSDVEESVMSLQKFCRGVAHCAITAHKISSLLVMQLTAKTSSGGASTSDQKMAAKTFPLKDVLDASARVEDELASLDPEEIVLHALMQHAVPRGGEVLLPLSITFYLALETDETLGVGDTSAAFLLYDSVYSSAQAARNVTRCHSITSKPGLPQRHLHLVRGSLLAHVDKGEYLEAYRLLHYLSNLKVMSTVLRTPLSTDGTGSRREKGHSDVDRHVAIMDKAMTVCLAVMLKGPAGRLDHARRLLMVLQSVILIDGGGGKQEGPTVPEEGTIKAHADYSICYLLDTLAEHPLVRFEGAIESLKNRARMLLDAIQEMVEKKGVSKHTSRAPGADSMGNNACELVQSVVSLLEIIQIAVEADTHRCCPQVCSALTKLRLMEKDHQAKEAATLRDKVNVKVKSTSKRKDKPVASATHKQEATVGRTHRSSLPSSGRSGSRVSRKPS